MNLKHNYVPQHKENIIVEKPIAKSALLPGTIITFSYVDEERVVRKRYVLVLNQAWHGYLHGLTLEQIPEKVLQRLAETIKLWYSTKLNEMLRLRLPLIKANVGNPKTFYESKLKPFAEAHMRNIDNPYREFKLNQMTNVKIVEYRFDLQERLDAQAAAKKAKELALLKVKPKGT